MTSHINTVYEYNLDGSISAVVRVNRCKKTAEHITLIDDRTIVIRNARVGGTICRQASTYRMYKALFIEPAPITTITAQGDARHNLIRNGKLDTHRLHKMLRKLYKLER